MKKALALVLALVLALSLGVSALALDLVDVGLKPVAPAGSAPKTALKSLKEFGWDLDDDTYLAPAEGGEYYFELKETTPYGYKNLEVEAKGAISAEIVKYNPDKNNNYNAHDWHVLDGEGKVVDFDALTGKDAEAYKKLAAKSQYNAPNGDYYWVLAGGEIGDKVVDTETGKWLTEIEKQVKNGKELDEIFEMLQEQVPADWWNQYDGIVEDTELLYDSYEFCKAVAEALNYNHKSARYTVSNGSENYLLKVTVEENYTAAYKEGSFKVTATRIDDVDDRGRVTETTKVTASGTVISDVSIFEVGQVKWAGAEEEVLYTNEKGYSDYLTTLSGYSNKEYNEDANRIYPDANVISTTAFKLLRNNKDGIAVSAEELLVEIPEIGASQKGVNFSAYGVTFLNAKGKVVDGSDDDVASIVFGFNGKQTIASDFTVTADLDVTAYELREMFGKKMEEEDVVTYYVLKDEKVIAELTYDYANDEIDEVIVLEIANKAGSTLGEYKIVAEAPASAPVEGEENPNTGAESVLGVVAAMAVVSVAAAAAVSLKK